MWVYVNGELLPEDEAKISVFDRGFLYGDGIFETIAVYNGNLFRLSEHLDRLWKSAASIFLTIPITREQLTQQLITCLEKNGLEDAVLRLSVTRGSGPRGLNPNLCGDASIVILCYPPPRYPDAMYHQGVSVTVADRYRVSASSPNANAKTNNFLINILAAKAAADFGATEAFMINTENYLTDGASSNIFLVRNGRVATPSLNSGVLAGITRQIVIDLCRKNNIALDEQTISKDELFSADEIFYTNTSVTIMPVARVDTHVLPTAAPGPVTRLLRKKILDLIRAEAGRYWEFLEPL